MLVLYVIREEKTQFHQSVLLERPLIENKLAEKNGITKNTVCVLSYLPL